MVVDLQERLVLMQLLHNEWVPDVVEIEVPDVDQLIVHVHFLVKLQVRSTVELHLLNVLVDLEEGPMHVLVHEFAVMEFFDH